MKRDTEKTVAIFRKWLPVEGGGIIALFPEIQSHEGISPRRMCSSYEHVGQHGAADYSHVVSRTTPAKPGEYAELRKELESSPYGYNFTIQRRRQR